jgi:5-methylcytosine-specific restriction endonuclease McrA
MTRKTPLRSKTPLKRSGRLRNASPKRQREYKEYAQVRKAYLALHPICERCKKSKASEIHHKAQRHGSLLNRYDLFAALCSGCHRWIHENGREARKQGWIIDTFHALPNPAPEPSEAQSHSQSRAHTPE